MKYPLILTWTFFTTLTVFLGITVTSGDEPACTPTGTHQGDNTSGVCSGQGNNTTALTKTGNWNVSWPDGHQDSVQPKGSGQCSSNLPCEWFAAYGQTYCWPSFYPPVTSSAGGFSILVENKVANVGSYACPFPPGGWDRRVYCETSRETIFVTGHTCPEEGGGCELPLCDAPFHTDMSQCCCANAYGSCEGSPILVDIDGDGFALTAPAGGVRFDVNSDGSSEKTAWTAIGVDDAWLVLDRNGNGRIDDGREMFGNFTFQPTPPLGSIRNGFLALAEYDKPINGGNDDGLITRLDSVFTSLRLWQDLNHNGISEPGELFGLSYFGLSVVELNYHESKRTDDYGNQFMFRAKVKDIQGNNIGRWAWDVFLISQP